MAAFRVQLFTVFHLNLAFSSIEEELRPEVIQRCYWPLLRMARDLGLRFGIETTVYTLESAAAIDPSWLAEFRALCQEGQCELVGSGYSQLIGPLVPAEVNAANLRVGNQGYLDLLGLKPKVALINEQAYSAGLLQQYIDAGYSAIIMEWDNPSRFHPQWDSSWSYLPQYAAGQHGERIPLLWNRSIAFQKFQRYAHGEMELPEFRSYLETHLAESPRCFSLYGNDVEIFDFRPGRFHTEPERSEASEWERLAGLFRWLRGDRRFELVLPSQTLALLNSVGAGNDLHLESAEDPIPVKKQEKYNINRWGVTGRNDLAINTACHWICEQLKARAADDDLWRELCYLWSSDFRTHITEKRWKAYTQRLAAFRRRLSSGGVGTPAVVSEVPPPQRTGVRWGPLDCSASQALPAAFHCVRKPRSVSLETAAMKLVLNPKRGLAITSLVIKSVSDKWLIGTLPHGYYSDIALGADYYSGHLVMETPGRPKITDLNSVEPEIAASADGAQVIVRGTLQTPFGPILKTIQVSAEGSLVVSSELQWETMPAGSLRLGHVTLNPEFFDGSRLIFETHNGGRSIERFRLQQGCRVEHGRPVSFLVSARSALGVTAGELRLGDEDHAVLVRVRQDSACLAGQITYIPVDESYFYRACFAAAELDDTCKEAIRTEFPRKFEFSITVPSVAEGETPTRLLAEAETTT